MFAEKGKWMVIGGLLLAFSAAVYALMGQWIMTAVMGGLGAVFILIGEASASGDEENDDAGR